MLAQGEAVKVAQDVAVVIPARYGSTRYPGKPLKMIAGWSMIHRVWCLAKAAPGVTSVSVATDDDRIAFHVRGFGGEAIMTPPECNDGTERVFRATEASSVHSGCGCQLRKTSPAHSVDCLRLMLSFRPPRDYPVQLRIERVARTPHGSDAIRLAAFTQGPADPAYMDVNGACNHMNVLSPHCRQ